MSGKVILVYPRLSSGWRAQPRCAPPMSLICVATPVHGAGYDVRIIDQRIEPNWRAILTHELDQDPICVGISSMTGPQLRFALEISQLVRAHGRTPVVWGGVHASLLPEQTLRNDCIDIIVQGEGEETFKELVQALSEQKPLGQVKGIWYKDGGHIKSTGPRPFVDINQLPLPTFELVKLERYRRVLFGVEHQQFFTSRGCNRCCAFCFNTVYNKQQWRAMSPERAVELIREFVTKYHVRGLVFDDSNFFLDLERARAIVRGIVDAQMDVVISKINLDAHTLCRMTTEDFELLMRAGCRRFPVAIESGSERVRTLLKKPVDVEQLQVQNRMLAHYEMNPGYLFMMGFPTETREDLAASVSLALRLVDENPKASVYFNIYTPYPGTELFALAVEHGMRIPSRTEDWILYHYRGLAHDAPWLSAHLRDLVRMLDFCFFFVGRQSLMGSAEETQWLAKVLARLYAPLARARVRNLWGQAPLEIWLSRILGIYGRE
jgi:radical SAM superfamily enzyme YgiQ (UPF0313 family)